jgi:hypothetical protein
VHELPPLPEDWAGKYEELYGSKPPEGVAPEEVKVMLEDAVKEEAELPDGPKPPQFDEKPVTVCLKRPLQEEDEMAIKDEMEEVRHLLPFIEAFSAHSLFFVEIFTLNHRRIRSHGP